MDGGLADGLGTATMTNRCWRPSFGAVKQKALSRILRTEYSGRSTVNIRMLLVKFCARVEAPIARPVITADPDDANLAFYYFIGTAHPRVWALVRQIQQLYYTLLSTPYRRASA